MEIEKILVVIDGKEYPFFVEIMHDEDDKIVYRVTPEETDPLLDEVSPGYIEFDEEGNAGIDDRLLNGRVRAATDAIWQGINEQLIKERPSLQRPG